MSSNKINANISISKQFTIKQYYEARDTNNQEIITKILNDRLETRYFKPISNLNCDSKDNIGYGFSIMVLICSLIEFLASCRNGQYYMYKNNESSNSKDNYSNSSKTFKNFLSTVRPFKSEFLSNKYENIADEFYSEVRCPLFHSASTGKDWVIIANIDDYETKHDEEWKTKIISYDKNRLVTNINRTIFVEKLVYYKNTYINSISTDPIAYKKLTIVLDHLFDYKATK